MLYPLKFTPHLLPKIWGGQHIRHWYPQVPETMENVGESWLISSVAPYPTEVSNGPLAGNELEDLIEVYMDELVGEAVYERFGNTFPLLLKFIDAADDLSVQVHPDDEQAAELEGAVGKNEMWYVMPSDPDASLILGWQHDIDQARVREAIDHGTLMNHLAARPVSEGDVAMINAGTVHALLHGTVVAEIQENSDVTYRLYDYDRIGDDGQKRPLHIDKSLMVMQYDTADKVPIIHPDTPLNQAVNAIRTPYFTTNILTFDRPVVRDYAPLNSFVAYMVVSGACEIEAPEADPEQQTHTLHTGEAILLPAILNDINLRPIGEHCKLLEIYIDRQED